MAEWIQGGRGGRGILGGGQQGLIDAAAGLIERTARTPGIVEVGTQPPPAPQIDVGAQVDHAGSGSELVIERAYVAGVPESRLAGGGRAGRRNEIGIGVWDRYAQGVRGNLFRLQIVCVFRVQEQMYPIANVLVHVTHQRIASVLVEQVRVQIGIAL